MHLKGNEIKKRWKVILKEGNIYRQDFGPYRFRFVALFVAFFVSCRGWADEIVEGEQRGCEASVYEIVESWRKDYVEELYKEMNTLFEKEGLSLKD